MPDTHGIELSGAIAFGLIVIAVAVAALIIERIAYWLTFKREDDDSAGDGRQ